MGKGYAIKYGIDRASGDLITFIDADMSIDPAQIDGFIRLMDEVDADIVIGSKRHPDSNVGYPVFRRLQSFIYQKIIAVLFHFNLRDTQTGLKLFRRDVLMRVIPRALVKAYAFDLELLVVAHHLGYTNIIEAPVDIRQQFSTTTNLRAAWNVLMDTFAIFYRLRVLNFYDRDHIFLDMEGTQLKVSIIVPVRGQASVSNSLARAYADLIYDDFEVLIVGDKIGTESAPGRQFKYLAYGCVSPTVKRDLAAEDAAGDILAFIDDDAAPKADWLIHAVRHFHAPEVAAVGGPTVTPLDSPVMETAGGAVYESRWGSGILFYRYVPRRPREINDCQMVNFLVRKDVFMRVGGFKTDAWPEEGRILCASFNKEGYKVIYDPDVVAYHTRRPLFRSHLKQVAEHAYNRGSLSRREPGYLSDYAILIPSLFVLGILFGPIAGMVGGPPLMIFAVIEGTYLFSLMISGLWAGFIRQSLAVGVLVIPGILATHLTYGAFFLRGFLSRKAV